MLTRTFCDWQRPVLLAITSAVAGCGAISHGVSEETETTVAVNGVDLTYVGEITHAANERLFSLAASRAAKPTTLVITSRGGDVKAGIELGTWVFESGLDVRVSEFCVSSCANYVFVAGVAKILEPTAMLAWHGGATQHFELSCKEVIREGDVGDCNDEELKNVLGAELDELRALETKFFERIGVDQEITVLGQRSPYDCRDSADYVGWYYSIEDMESMGVDGIVILGTEWTPVTPSPGIRICRVDLGRSSNTALRTDKGKRPCLCMRKATPARLCRGARTLYGTVSDG